MNVIEKADWKVKGMPLKLRTTIALNREYSASEIDVMRRGHYPQEMGDRWFMYWSKDRLYMHRSRTGNCIYVIKFVPNGDGYRMTEAVVNRNPKQYGETRDEVDVEEIAGLIDVVLLMSGDRIPESVPRRFRSA
jgi:8-oxo-dGTP diphosphatase